MRQPPDGRSLLRAPTFLFLILFLLAGCRAAENDADRAPLRVLASDFAPFYYRDGDGQAAGLEHLILQSFARAEDREVEVVWVDDFGTIFEALERGEGDLIASTLTITEERARRLDFTAPYFPVLALLVERKSWPSLGLASLPGRKVVTIKGTTYERILNGIEGIEIVYVRTEEEMYQMVARGDADALVTDSANFLWIGRRFPELHITAPLSERSFYGFAVRKNDPLRDEFDRHLEEIKRSGVYWGFVEEVFGEIAGEYLEDLKAGDEEFLSPER